VGEGKEKLMTRKENVKMKRMREMMKIEVRSGGTGQPGLSSSACDLYLRVTGIESRLGHKIFQLMLCVVV
jgi:hypothetical protein